MRGELLIVFVLITLVAVTTLLLMAAYYFSFSLGVEVESMGFKGYQHLHHLVAGKNYTFYATLRTGSGQDKGIALYCVKHPDKYLLVQVAHLTSTGREIFYAELEFTAPYNCDKIAIYVVQLINTTLAKKIQGDIVAEEKLVELPVLVLDT